MVKFKSFTKVMLFAALVMLFSTKLSAQKLIEGSLEPLYGQTTINCVFDFMQAEAAGLPLDEFFEWKTAEDKKGKDFSEEYARGQKVCQMKFMEKANDKLKGVRLAKKEDAPYTLTVKMLTVDKAGRNNLCDYIFTNTETGETVAVVQMEGHGGRIGGFVNLMGDAFSDGGEQFGKWLNKQLEQIGKAQKKKK